MKAGSRCIFGRRCQGRRAGAVGRWTAQIAPFAKQMPTHGESRQATMEHCMRRGTRMKTAIQIVDLGRGPQLSTSRITVMDVFYYLHRGRDWRLIQQAMPTLTREEFDVVVDYVDRHR